ncbi:MAG: small ribosomal subunit Rsm22 family protein [Myxococcota bacterium]|jgi:ribosomal protein RSM22 (predicted rRNA methylase)|nr:small ribosomal subunit Rsm22 family protein [Myxococcota bacterium]HON25255.1 small ribosomal subunit Rsm22 family protein [Myxococcota bacterium]HOS61418.1 small ribosomal subunit Rsm22 family protein [Myxococcota bacterium]HPC91094.1 small ribosomal subunit Rsm22 family protein [Myxococcota bacterium]HPL24388.1 small ribosomal subunit Rsm22 family protein [Myxococcota bacterium]
MEQTLFPPLPADSVATLNKLDSALATVFPLKPKFRQDLPYAVKDLSDYLTRDRALRRPDYMAEPRFFSAYLYYFLPWNLLRLARLFKGLQIDVPSGSHLLDLGSGPLTVPLAMYIGLPHLRDRELTFTCVDLAPRSMRVGMDLFKALAGQSCPWKFNLVKGSLDAKNSAPANWVVAANAFNEFDSSARSAAKMERSAHILAKAVGFGGQLLLIEPGTRWGGRAISKLREMLIEQGFVPLAPCTHSNECPMPGDSRSQWCHFNFDVKGAPKWLVSLTARAKMPKEDLSLSLFLATKGDVFTPDGVRVISQKFFVPAGLGQYGCSAKGLTLIVTKKGGFFPGQLLKANWPQNPELDRKSGAVILPVLETK